VLATTRVYEKDRKINRFKLILTCLSNVVCDHFWGNVEIKYILPCVLRDYSQVSQEVDKCGDERTVQEDDNIPSRPSPSLEHEGHIELAVSSSVTPW
jgi:hypothetical protein